MHVEIDLRGQPRQDQWDFWQSVTPSAYKVQGPAGNEAFDIRARIHELPGAVVTRFASGAHTTVREVSGRPRYAPFVKLRLYLEGGATIHHGGGISHLRPGDLYMIDQSRGFSSRHARHEQLSIFVPHDRIGYDPAEHPAVLRFGSDTPDGRLLTLAVRAFFRRVEQGEQDIEPILRTLAAALRGSLRSSRDRSVRATRAEALRSHVSEQPGGRTLTAEELAETFGLSRAGVFRAFEETGGVRRFQYEARLKAARDRLCRGPVSRGAIGALAQDLGFSSTAHFSDAFLHKFGPRPSKADQLTRNEGATAALRPLNDPGNLDETLRLARSIYAKMTG